MNNPITPWLYWLQVCFAAIQIIGSVSRSTGVVWPEPWRTFAGYYEAAAEINVFESLPLACHAG